MKNTIKELKQLPSDVQVKVAKMVGGYFGTEAVVTRNNGKYEVADFVCLSNFYADDHKTWYFDRKTVEQDDLLKAIVLEEDAESKRWEQNEGKDFDWEAFGQ